MKVHFEYKQVPNQSTSTEPSVYELKLSAEGSKEEIESYAMFLCGYGMSKMKGGELNVCKY